MKRNLHNEMQAAFAKHGLMFGLKDQSILKRLRKTMGSERFDEMQRVWKQMLVGQASPQALCDYLETAEQLHAVMSTDSRTILDANAFLYSKVCNYLKPQGRVVDLGCATGAMVAWICSQHPDCTAIGIDFNSRAISIAKELVRARNAEFVEFDYSQGLPPPVQSCDTLICSFGIRSCRPNVGEPCSSLTSEAASTTVGAANRTYPTSGHGDFWPTQTHRCWSSFGASMRRVAWPSFMPPTKLDGPSGCRNLVWCGAVRKPFRFSVFVMGARQRRVT